MFSGCPSFCVYVLAQAKAFLAGLPSNSSCTVQPNRLTDHAVGRSSRPHCALHTFLVMWLNNINI